jgi:hypothetical protein
VPVSSGIPLIPYRRLGDWFAWLCLIVAVAALGRGARRPDSGRANTVPEPRMAGRGYARLTRTLRNPTRASRSTSRHCRRARPADGGERRVHTDSNPTNNRLAYGAWNGDDRRLFMVGIALAAYVVLCAFGQAAHADDGLTDQLGKGRL